jgi:hypothetical protein
MRFPLAVRADHHLNPPNAAFVLLFRTPAKFFTSVNVSLPRGDSVYFTQFPREIDQHVTRQSNSGKECGWQA